MLRTRQPAVAGAFYPADKDALVNAVKTLLNRTESDRSSSVRARQKLKQGLDDFNAAPKALIVPHAGYIYSGTTAASAYEKLSPHRDIIKRVVILGPVHRLAVRGLALPGADIFETPLGQVQIDQDAVEKIENLPQVSENAAAHAEEHSIEVHLPFLQLMLTDFKLLPLVVGDASPEEVAQVINVLWGGSETLIVVSSDLSHFLPYESAQRVDSETAETILQMKSTLNHQQACGGTPVNGLLMSARQHQLQPHLLDLRNSGDVAADMASDKSRVVGYGSFAFTEV